jgi:hypothetical protein
VAKDERLGGDPRAPAHAQAPDHDGCRCAAVVRAAWASTYAFFDGPKAFEVLARRMDARPELGVTLLLNIQRKRGDTTATDQLVRKFADRFWGTDWPGSSRPTVYYDPRALELDGPAGVLHAKAVVADDEAVFVLRKRELGRLRAADYRARKRGRDQLPKRINETLKRGQELSKAAKGLAES